VIGLDDIVLAKEQVGEYSEDWHVAHGLDLDGLRAWAIDEAEEDIERLGYDDLPLRAKARLGAALATGYHLGFILGVLAARQQPLRTEGRGDGT
jgi:hypothetical protein